MSTPNISGTVRFNVEGQKAYPKWAQEAIQNALKSQEAPPESLRFQCRIATDARENFREIKLKDGETLRLHPKSHPQFGKNHKGHPYLTATMTYSGDGENYTIKWVGDAVPTKMQEIAVKHDKGLSVRATTVGLELEKAIITPAWKAHKNGSRTPESVIQDARKRRANNRGRTPKKRTCARMTDRDVQAVA